MSYRPLVIDPDTMLKLHYMVQYAERHVYSIDDVLDIYNGDMQPPGEKCAHTCILPFGYRVVFSIEQTPIGNARHLSVSVDEEGILPGVEVVKEIMRLIGFKHQLNECYVKIEKTRPRYSAINVAEIIKD